MLTPRQIEAARRLDAERKARLVELLKERTRREKQRLFDHMFPDETHVWLGETYHARDLYPKHLEFFEAGRDYRERCAMAANRVGKTLGMGGYESACHLTGLYPAWWNGRRFKRPVEWWAAGKTNETTRDIVQATLLGPVRGSAATKQLEGTGVVRGDLIGRPTWKSGVQNLVDVVPIRHASGGWSLLGLKSYDQGRGAFEGTAKHGIWLDEEPPLDVYGECLIRTATTRGIIMLTFTPLIGMSQTVLQFLPKEG